MRHFRPRKSSPAVRRGTVQHKSNWTETALDGRPGCGVVIRRERPGANYRHVLLQRDIERFIALLPDWDALSQGLRSIVLAPGDPDCLGWYKPGLVAVCAWERDMVQRWSCEFFADHCSVLDRLGVECARFDDERGPGIRCEFTERSARGFLLMHILLHELGHHHDLITTRSRRGCARGEPYAEGYALDRADELWDRYIAAFGW